MRDLGFNVPCKTTFSVESAEADGDVPRSIVLAVKCWLGPEWARRSCHLSTDDLSRSAFKTGCKLHSMDDVDLVSLESVQGRLLDLPSPQVAPAEDVGEV